MSARGGRRGCGAGGSATGIPSAPSPGSISLVEPGPVTTEFEAKVYEEAERADYSQTDPETTEIFTKLYLRNSKDVFASLGQSPEDIAEVMGAPARVGWAGHESSISANEERRSQLDRLGWLLPEPEVPRL